jgi:hypothetical protein
MGGNERIEITNFANTVFKGDIILSGLSANNQLMEDVEIPAYSSRIVGKSPKGIPDDLLLVNNLIISKLKDDAP